MSDHVFQGCLLRGEAEPTLQTMPHNFQIGGAPVAGGAAPRTLKKLAIGSDHQTLSTTLWTGQSVCGQLKLGCRTHERAGKVMQRAIALDTGGSTARTGWPEAGLRAALRTNPDAVEQHLVQLAALPRGLDLLRRQRWNEFELRQIQNRGSDAVWQIVSQQPIAGEPRRHASLRFQ